jgi:hypothetical protein
MMFPLLLSCALVAASGPQDTLPKPAPSALNAYTAAKAKAGQSADAQVRLALWCEAHGLSAERTKHLALATLLDPLHATARGLLGLVSYQGKWQSPDEITRQVQEDPVRKALLQDYLQRRAKTSDKADDQWKLALWCEGNGLKEQATAHLYQVLKRDPGREAAWKRLGFKKVGGRWVKPEILAAAKAELEAQNRANKFWKPRLEHWRNALSAHDRIKRVEAEQALGQITDPRAVPMLWHVLARGDEGKQHAAVKILGQIEAPGSSRGLALLGLFSPSASVRQACAEMLRRRDPREFAGLLVAMIRNPVKYKVRPVGGPGSPGVLMVEGSQADTQRQYSPPPSPSYIPAFNDTVFPDANGQPVIYHPLGYYALMEGQALISELQARAATADRVTALFGQAGLGQAGHSTGQAVAANLHSAAAGNLATAHALMKNAGPTASAPHGFETVMPGAAYAQIPIGQMMAAAEATAVLAQQQLAADVQSIEELNATIAHSNANALQMLNDVSGQNFGADRNSWEKWLTDLNGYAYASPPAPTYKPTVVEEVPVSIVPPPPIITSVIEGPLMNIPRHSCFAAGTLVWTQDGKRPIEQLQYGDQVLTRNTASGVLGFQPVVTSYHNPPNATFRIDLGQETIVATGIHRFWKAGVGWVMARELKPGDQLRTVSGSLSVTSVKTETIQPVFNLELAGGDSFFVGTKGVLAHDNSVVSPVEKPFDRVPTLDDLTSTSSE